MAERGRVYFWPRNRSFGDGKPRPVVVFPLSTTAELANNPLAYPLGPSAANGLRVLSLLQGPLGRISSAELKDIAAGMVATLDLQCLPAEEPYAFARRLQGKPGCTVSMC
jgi:hypothetical protein